RRRACTNCTAGKAKCQPFSPGKCERCHRLGKECHYAHLAITRKRPQPNSTFSSPSKSQRSTSAGTPNSSGPPNRSPPRIASIRVHNASDGAGDIINRAIITPDLAQGLLDSFRIHAVRQFPFVTIPADASLETVRSQTPFLFLAIMATMMCDNPFLQHKLGDEILQHAFQKMFSGTDKSLELLQGLLVYTAWYCHFYHRDKHHELLMSQFCVTLAHDLGLDRGKKRQADQLVQCERPPDTELSGSLANAQMRAYLGSYCVSCAAASVLRKRTAISYTKYMDYCCRSLAQLREYETDALIPYFVRSVEISRRVFDTFSYDDPQNSEVRGEFLVRLSSDTFLRELDGLKQEVSSNLKMNTFLELELHIIRVIIDEAALHTELWDCEEDAHPTADGSLLHVTRAKMLSRSLASCRDFILTFLSYQNQDLFYLTIFGYSRLC
ncbi:hypothetical protein GQ53DRAFT_626427, partial [Thozetella sp. PMI_491]